MVLGEWESEEVLVLVLVSRYRPALGDAGLASFNVMSHAIDNEILVKLETLEKSRIVRCDQTLPQKQRNNLFYRVVTRIIGETEFHFLDSVLDHIFNLTSKRSVTKLR